MNKIRYPKCPYCGKQFEERGLCDIDGQELTKLATRGDMKETKITCPYCNEQYKVTCKIMFYGTKNAEQKM